MEKWRSTGQVIIGKTCNWGSYGKFYGPSDPSEWQLDGLHSSCSFRLIIHGKHGITARSQWRIPHSDTAVRAVQNQPSLYSLCLPIAAAFASDGR